jgi:hypothetical protein
MSLNIRTWLEAGGFGQYADAFEANEIDGEALPGDPARFGSGEVAHARGDVLDGAEAIPGSSPSPGRTRGSLG